MVTTLNHLDGKVYGPNGESVLNLLNRLSDIDWFSAIEDRSNQLKVEKVIDEFGQCLGMEEYKIAWMNIEQVPSFLDEIKLESSPLWKRLQSITTKIKDQAIEVERLHILTHVTETVPELIFHSCFDSAFHKFQNYGVSFVKTTVVFMMYLYGLVCAWETLADLKGWEKNPFISIIEVLEHGHWPLGLYEHQFYVI